MAMIQTTLGEMDEALLDKKEGAIDNEQEHITWVEYWFDGALVHRSAHVTLKQWPEGLGALLSDFNG